LNTVLNKFQHNFLAFEFPTGINVLCPSPYTQFIWFNLTCKIFTFCPITLFSPIPKSQSQQICYPFPCPFTNAIHLCQSRSPLWHNLFFLISPIILSYSYSPTMDICQGRVVFWIDTRFSNYRVNKFPC
jgi:hypothetical protein